ncbi:MAG: response regulator [Elusimicrobia bacterium CG08_land_8_20_14_0_20_44_26]|nr:MAG: response regulator [Elusimicrobia bacterium CG08_land_8_20_14_0_20_44_26]
MKKILLVDDDTVIREVIRAMLEELGDCEITEAETGKELILKAKASPPDLIICDIIMPGLSGYRAVGELRKEKKLANIPVIFNSASVKDREMHHMLKPQGPCTFMIKPFKFQEFIPLVKKALDTGTIS